MLIKNEQVPRVLPVHVYICVDIFIYIHIYIHTTKLIKHERVPRVLPVHIYLHVHILYIHTYKYYKKNSLNMSEYPVFCLYIYI